MRDIDVAFFAPRSERQRRVLAQCGRVLRRHSTRLVCEGESATTLRRARVVLNVHSDEDAEFDWEHATTAIHCGAVIVTERSTGMAPLRAGRDLLVSSTAALPWVLEHALKDLEQLDALRASALDTVRHAGLTVAAKSVDLEDLSPPEAPHTAPQPRALQSLRLDLLELRRRIAQNAVDLRGAAPPQLELIDVTPAYTALRTPDVTVAISTSRQPEHAIATLNSVVRTFGVSAEIVLIDDALDVGPATPLREWIEQHPSVPALLLRHPVNRGLGAARNTALDFARGPLFMVLDAGNEIAPAGLRQLAEAFDEHDVAFAYGALEFFDAAGPTQLTNTTAWDPQRLAHGNFIDAMAMLRTRALRSVGGFTTELQLHGWEHYDLWCALVEQGGRATFVPSVVGRRRVTASSAAEIDLDHEQAFDVVRERHPRLMAPSEQPRDAFVSVVHHRD